MNNTDITYLIKQMLSPFLNQQIEEVVTHCVWDYSSQENSYMITPKQSLSIFDPTVNTMIEAISYPSQKQIFVFLLGIEQGNIKKLEVTKRDDKSILPFTMEEIKIVHPQFTYERSIFPTIQYLPLGSVVTLHKGRKKLMIYARKIMNTQDNKEYAYAGCFYPEGVLHLKEMILFNEIDIHKVHYLGMQGIEEEYVTRKMDEVSQ